jgi:RNA polymerase sigma-70 factor (ECF subfamily)
VEPGVGLLDEARADPGAFAILYRRHYDDIFRYCQHRVFNRHVAEDLTSAVFMKVLMHLPKFHGDETAFTHWTYRIATNTANTYLRQEALAKKRLRVLADDTDVRWADSPESALCALEDTAVVRAAVLALRQRYQEVVALRYFENKEVSEIAVILRRRQVTVRKRLSRALAELRGRLVTRTIKLDQRGSQP